MVQCAIHARHGTCLQARRPSTFPRPARCHGLTRWPACGSRHGGDGSLQVGASLLAMGTCLTATPHGYTARLHRFVGLSPPGWLPPVPPHRCLPTDALASSPWRFPQLPPVTKLRVCHRTVTNQPSERKALHPFFAALARFEYFRIEKPQARTQGTPHTKPSGEIPCVPSCSRWPLPPVWA